MYSKLSELSAKEMLCKNEKTKQNKTKKCFHDAPDSLLKDKKKNPSEFNDCKCALKKTNYKSYYAYMKITLMNIICLNLDFELINMYVNVWLTFMVNAFSTL